MVDFPVLLAVTFLILAIFVPIALGMVSNLEHDSAASAAKAEAEKIENTAKKTYYSGIGSTDTVSVSVSGGSCLMIGGEGSDQYCISIMLGDTVAEKIYLERPSVKFLGDPVYIMGNKTISVKCAVEGGAYGIKVSVLD